MKKLLLAGLVLASTIVFAETPAKPAPAPTIKLSPAQKNTIKSCYANATINDDGRPDRKGVEACLTKNKIVLPHHERKGGWRDMKPEDSAKMKQAFEDCRAQGKPSGDKKADHEAMHACMEAKGIQLPSHHGKRDGQGKPGPRMEKPASAS